MKRRGLSLIELIIGATIIGIAFYSLIAVMVTLAPRTARLETLTKKIFIVSKKAEEYNTIRFNDVWGEPPTPDGGGIPGYTYEVVVTYVATSDLNTAVVGPTPFKNVKFRVWGGPVDQAGTVEIVSLIASYEVK
jgi:prepilin-type N-terminal cleavage/methylation domain-containing protein